MWKWRTNRILGPGAALLMALVLLTSVCCQKSGAAPAERYRAVPFDGKRAMEHLVAICAIGRRVSGTEGMQQQQQMLEKYFTDLGAQVEMQAFPIRHPLDGSPVELANMIVHWHPEKKERILLCAHYDTRPFPDRDPKNKQGVFVGANDGASGVALLMELGLYMKDLKSPFGVDFILFDGEELVYSDLRDSYFLGSEYFAGQYVSNPPDYRYRAGLLVDMVGDADLQIYQERNSLSYAPTMVRDVWTIAKELGVREFVPRPRHTVRDDHLALNRTAKIPTIDLIDFDYPRPGYAYSYWHTQADVPDNCSADSLEKVGKVVHEWLRRLEDKPMR
ncbi:M28 family peptidase [Lignipirellula cremea]|uniref:Peptidase family M28 n=1 Tax=Lignipirellula cremea TaxID=2528010 RepID=A0A518DR13_9BACT|nr:M28 family peptidase [Lignipirellula cremea]QDU94277.1 Peptidase family M28 [Lignipirellula cremea]